MKIIIPQIEDIIVCAKVYISAYSTEPWNEKYDISDVEKYISSYLNSDTKCCFTLLENNEIKGVALGLIVPSISGPYFRLEDFCIDVSEHRNGFGSVFVELLIKEVAKYGCDSVLLGTQKEHPSHQFYIKNGFQEVESILLYKGIEQ